MHHIVVVNSYPLCHWFLKEGAFFFSFLLLHELIYLDLPALCIACDLNADLERAHPSDRKLSIPPSLIRFFCNYAALRGGNGCL